MKRDPIRVKVYAARTTGVECSDYIVDRERAIRLVGTDEELCEGEIIIRRPRASEVRERLRQDPSLPLPGAVFRAMLLSWAGILDESAQEIEYDDSMLDTRLDESRDGVIDRMGCMDDLFLRMGFDGPGGPLK